MVGAISTRHGRSGKIAGFLLPSCLTAALQTHCGPTHTSADSDRAELTNSMRNSKQKARPKPRFAPISTRHALRDGNRDCLLTGFVVNVYNLERDFVQSAAQASYTRTDL